MRVGPIVCCLSLLVVGAPAWAQPATPRVEIFGGYSLLPADPATDFPRRTSHGFQVGAAGNLTDWFGVFADLGLHWNTNRDVGPHFEGIVARTRVTQFLFGPRFTARSERVNVFAHGFVGRVRGDAGENFSGFSDTKPAFGGGVGIDVRLHERLAVRGQFDLFASFTDIVEGNTRAAVGLVLGLGGS
jgi:hypothetical protein